MQDTVAAFLTHSGRNVSQPIGKM